MNDEGVFFLVGHSDVFFSKYPLLELSHGVEENYLQLTMAERLEDMWKLSEWDTLRCEYCRYTVELSMSIQRCFPCESSPSIDGRMPLYRSIESTID